MHLPPLLESLYQQHGCNFYIHTKHIYLQWSCSELNRVGDQDLADGNLKDPTHHLLRKANTFYLN